MKKKGLIIVGAIILIAAYWFFFMNDNDAEKENILNGIKQDSIEVEMIASDPENDWEIYMAEDNVGKIDYYVFMEKRGYRSDIQTITHINDEGYVADVQIVKQNETNNKGALVVDEDFLSQFEDKDETWDGTCEAISGATISSDAVAESVCKSLELYGEYVLCQKIE